MITRTSEDQFHNINFDISHDMKTTTTSEQHLLQDSQGQETKNEVYEGPAKANIFADETWVLECVASGVSIAGLVALVAVLAHFNHKDSQELGYGVTLNALVAAMSTVIRTSTMVSIAEVLGQAKWLWFGDARQRQVRRLADLEVFDKATRGSWGSLLLLWRIKGLYVLLPHMCKLLITDVRNLRHLAAIGAILSIASLPFGTFTQQALTTVYHQAPLSRNGSGIVRSEFFDSWAQDFNAHTRRPASSSLQEFIIHW